MRFVAAEKKLYTYVNITGNIWFHCYRLAWRNYDVIQYKFLLKYFSIICMTLENQRSECRLDFIPRFFVHRCHWETKLWSGMELTKAAVSSTYESDSRFCLQRIDFASKIYIRPRVNSFWKKKYSYWYIKLFTTGIVFGFSSFLTLLNELGTSWFAVITCIASVP